MMTRARTLPRPSSRPWILDLEILAIADRLIVSAQEREGNAGRPVAVMEELAFAAGAVAGLSSEIQRCLSYQREPAATRTRLEKLGLQLFDLLLGPRIKALVQSSRASHLILRLHSSLLDIPWELLHTGDEFFCIRFAMGRTVKLEAVPSTRIDRPVSRPYRMLILCDPRGDLPHAAEEGLALLRALVPREEDLSPDLLCAPISRQQVIEELRRYDLVHYAGHAVASSGDGPAGWLLDDAPFSADDIVRMQGSRAFPVLIFANACLSGTATGFGAYAMPRAWLDAGVRHYIGAVSDLPDTTGGRAADRFYPALLSGQSVGEALRQAREAIAADRTLPSLAWAGYLLYGDPTDCYFDAEERLEGEERTGPPGPRPPIERRNSELEAVPSIRSRFFRLLLGGVVGLLLGLLGAAGLLEAFDLVWESGRYLGHREDRWFGTRITLLSIRPGRQENARGLYAELLEQLEANGVRPKLVAIDTWITDRRTDHDGRLIQAIARSIEHFPVILGLDNDRKTGAVLPPPSWLEQGLRAAIEARVRAACASAAEKGEAALKGCVDSRTRTYETHGLLWANLWIRQPPWFLEHFGLRIPLVRRAAGTGGGEPAMAYQRPHFAVVLANPELGGVDPSSGRIRSSDAPILAAYDRRGYMPVVFTGKASWEGKASYPAYDLEALLEGWRIGSPVGPEVGVTPPKPWELTDIRLLVGIAGANMSETEADQYDTPLGKMFGVEVLANAAESLVQRKVPTQAPPWVALPAAGLAGVAGVWLGTRRPARRWLVAVAGAMLGASYALLIAGRVALPPTAALLALFVGWWLTSRRARAAAVMMLLLCAGPSVRAEGSRAEAAGTAGAPADPTGPVIDGRRIAQRQPPGRASTAQVSPTPPAVPSPAPEPAGWRIVDLRPPRLLTGEGLRLEAGKGGGPGGNGGLAPGAALPAGAVLRSTLAEAEVMLEFRDPARGVILHHALWGAFEATLAPDGSLEIGSGSVWTRLFRYLEEAASPFYMKYDGMQAGFGSTEVGYRGPGRGGRTLSVLEGRVTYQRGKQALVLEAGQRAKWKARPGRPRQATLEQRREWGALGTAAELATLAPDRVCASRLPALTGATLVSGACFPDRAARDGQLEAARESFATATGAADWRKMGEAYLAAGALGPAADSYRRGVRAGGDPKEVARMQLELGNIRWMQGDAAGAKRAYAAAVAVDPEQAPAWNNLGVMQWRDGELEPSRESLKRATDLDPKLFQGWRNLGRVWFAQKPAEALRAWEQAASIVPGDPALWRDLGLTYAVEGRVDRAMEAVKRSTTLDPRQAELWYKLGQWYWEQGRKVEAIDAYDRAAEIEMRTK